MLPIDLAVEAQGVGGVDEPEETGGICADALERDLAIQLVFAAHGLIEADLHRILVRSVQHRDLVVVLRVSHEIGEGIEAQKILRDRINGANRAGSQVAAALSFRGHQAWVDGRRVVPGPLVSDEEVRAAGKNVGNIEWAAECHHPGDRAVARLGFIQSGHGKRSCIKRRVVEDQREAAGIESSDSFAGVAECLRQRELGGCRIV